VKLDDRLEERRQRAYIKQIMVSQKNSSAKKERRAAMLAAKVTLSFNSALEFLLLQGANIKSAFLCSFMTPVIINLTQQLSADTGV
jgi:hypothetical protein